VDPTERGEILLQVDWEYKGSLVLSDELKNKSAGLKIAAT